MLESLKYTARGFAKRTEDFDGFGSLPPSEEIAEKTCSVLDLCADFLPSRMLAAHGEICLLWFIEDPECYYGAMSLDVGEIYEQGDTTFYAVFTTREPSDNEHRIVSLETVDDVRDFLQEHREMLSKSLPTEKRFLKSKIEVNE